MRKEQFDIKGMTCSACSSRVESCVLKLPGVREVSVSLEDKSARVKLSQNVSDDIFQKAVQDAGYEMKGIE